MSVLDEVVVSPENTEKFIDLKQEEFEKIDYSFDKSTRIENQLLQSGRFNNGLNFINLYKVISQKNRDKQKLEESENSAYKPSNLLREVYDDNFFINNLSFEIIRIFLIMILNI